MNVSNGKIAVLVSGGLDSCVLVAHIAAGARTVYPVYVQQGLVWEAVERHWMKKFLAAVAAPNIEPLREIAHP
jgi:7-cyano-7-deazaguanine synthase